MIGIIGAMAVEVDGLLAIMENTDKTTIGGMNFYAGEIAGKWAVVARCGVGKVHAAMCAQTMIVTFPLVAMVNLGAAGAIDNTLNIGDVVVSSDLVHHDARATTFGYEIGQIPGLDVLAFVSDKRLVKSAMAAYDAIFASGINRAHHGRISTGDQFINSMEQKQQIWSDFAALCVEMEGAAIAQVCYLNNIPFVAIRAISDRADGSAEVDFAKFIEQAAENSIRVVTKMMGESL